jgi:hypothetical protein
LFSHVVCKLEDRDKVANTEAETHDQIDSHRPRFYNGHSMIVVRMETMDLLHSAAWALHCGENAIAGSLPRVLEVDV